jgi:site-specific DNA-methyltransferase (cytosine-N4-specific)
MKDLLSDNNYYKPNVLRPSEHKISANFYNGNGGAIPPNILQYGNTDSQSKYLKLCRRYGLKQNPARYPVKLPEFFIKFLTETGDIVLDPFAGSNATGEAAEKLGRHWISIEIDPTYVLGSMFRFYDKDVLESKFGFVVTKDESKRRIPKSVRNSKSAGKISKP